MLQLTSSMYWRHINNNLESPKAQFWALLEIGEKIRKYDYQYSPYWLGKQWAESYYGIAKVKREEIDKW